MKNILITILLCFMASAGTLWAQNNDCIDALPICTTSGLNFASGNSGAGTADPGLTLGCATESQSSWYYFTITTGGTLTFVIDPVNNSTDYDYALYLSPYGSPATPATDCNGSNELGAPVRCNFSATTGNTGLSTTATNSSENASGPSFSSALTVTAGQVYYIMINNFTGDGYPFSFAANTGNTAVLSCTGVISSTSPCTCTTPTCADAYHTTEAAAVSENGTITTGADCSVFSPVIPVETDGSTDMTFCADRVIPAGVTQVAFTTTGQYKFVSGGTCTGTILSRTVYASGSCGSALSPTGNVTAGGRAIYAVTPGSTYVFCQTIRLAGPDCLQYNSSCINVFSVPAPPANDQCAGAVAITCGTSTSGTTLNATTTNDPTVTCNGETVDAPGVWYTFTNGVTPQTVTLDTDNGTTNFDTKIHVYTASACGGAYTCVTADDDAGAGTTSLATFAAAASTTYYVLVNGVSGATGNFALDVACVAAPVNDVCSGALTLTCGSTLTGQNNTSAGSTEDGLVCGTTVGTNSRGMWYQLVGDGRIATITTTTFTSPEITVWTGSDCSSLTCLSGVLAATHTFTAEAGVTYYVLISTDNGAASTNFSVGLTCATPAYNVDGSTTNGGTAFCNNNNTYGATDAFPTNTLVVTAATGTLRDPGGTSTYTNSRDGVVIICPNGGDGGTTTLTFTSFSTESCCDLVYVYDGPNSNYPQTTIETPATPGSPYAGNPTVPFSITSTNATGCLTVRFDADASNVSTGFEANWTSSGNTGTDLVANDNCSNAIEVGVECPTVSGTNINATASCSDPLPSFFSRSVTSGSLENTVWYKFTVSAADAGSTIVTLSNITCPDFANTNLAAASRGLQMGVYDGGTGGGTCPPASVNHLSTSGASGAGSTLSATVTTVAGRTYYIGIDGFAGSSCDFDITIDRYATNFAVNSSTSGSYTYSCDASPAQTADVALTLSGGRTTGYSVTVVPSSISVTNSGAVYTLNNIVDGTTWTATATDGLCTQIISGVYSYDATCNSCPSYSKSNITLTPTTSTVCAGQTVTFNTLAVDAARSVPTVRAATLGGRKYGDGAGGTPPLNYVADYKKYIHLLPVTMNAATIGSGVADAQVNGLDFTINAKWNDMYIALKNTTCAGSVVIWNGVNNTAFAGGTDATVSTGSTTLTFSAATGLFSPNASVSSYSSTATLAAMNTAFAGCDPEGFYLEINDQNNAVLQYSINNFLFSLTDKTTTTITPTSTLTNIAWVGSGAATGGVSGTHTNVAELTLSNSDKNATFTAPACAGPGNCVYTYVVTGKDVNGCTVTGTATINVQPAATIATGATVNPSACGISDGSIALSFTNVPNGTYTLSYLKNGVATTSTITVTSNAATLSALGQGTYTNFSITTGSCTATTAGPVTLAGSGPTGVGATICAGGSGSLSSPTVCPSGFVNSGTTISGSWTATDPTARRLTVSIVNTNTCSFDASITRNYSAIQFQVSTTGNYVFEMDNNAGYDGMGYIVSGAFVPGTCPGAGTWVRGDDDNGVAGNEPRLGASGNGDGTMNLTAGTTYTLISTTYAGSSGTFTGTFGWTITPPAGGQVMLNQTGTLQWYTTASGGTPVQTGTPFNPVGDAEVLAAGAPYSSLNNTNTAGTYNFYVACSGDPTCRTLTTFVISPAPTITLGTNPTMCFSTVATTANLPYTATTGTPDQYSIDFNAAANAAGLADVSLTTLPASPIVITVPSGLAAATYNGTITVHNSTTTCSSTATAFTLTVNPNPTITLSSTNAATCAGNTSATLAYTATTGTPNQYSLDFDATAEGQGFVDVTNTTLPATPITITVPAGATAGTYNATLTVRNSTTGCVSAVQNVTVTVNARPVITAGLAQTVCSGTAASRTITLSTDLAGTETFAWSAPAMTAGISGGTAGNTTSITDVLSNSGTTAGTATYTVTVTAAAADGGCTSTRDVVITVNPVPVITSGLTAEVCSGVAASRSITLSTDPTGTETYSWAAPTNTGGMTGGTSGTTPPITGTFTNTSGSAQTATYTVTVTGAAGVGSCTSTSNVVITVNPLPTVNAGSDVTICSGGSAPLSASGSGGTGTLGYAWLPTTALSSTNTANTTATPTSTITYVVTVTDTKSCTATDNVQVTVNPNPTFTGSASCSGGPGTGSISQSASGGSGAGYTYAVTGGSFGPNLANGTYTVMVTDSNDCTGTSNVMVSCALTCPGTIAPTQATAVVVTNSVCSAGCTPSGGSFSAPLTNNCPVGSTLQYSINGGTTWSSTVPTYNQTAAVTVLTRCNCNLDGTAVSAASSTSSTPGTCSLPAATAGSNSPVVLGGTINLTSGPAGAASYSWSGPGGYTALVQNPTRNLADPSMSGTYTVTVTGTNGCTASASASVTVTSSFTFSITDPCTCRNNATTLTNGQFTEVVTALGPAGFVVRAQTITGLYQTTSTAQVIVPFSVPVNIPYNGIDGYSLTGVHVDNIGYTVVAGFYLPDGITPIDLDAGTPGVQNTLSLTNKCAYPNPDFGLAASVCNNATPITLTATNGYGPNGSGVFSGTGVSGNTFTPATAGVGGPYPILLNYTGGVNGALSPDGGTTPAFPGCVQQVTKSISVTDCCNANSGSW